jgi:TonB family protein
VQAAAAEPRYLTSLDYQSQTPAPAYPIGVKVNGSVRIELLVAADGSVKDVTVIKSEPQGVFDAATIAAAKQWRIKPAVENGVPVESRVRTQVDFVLEP